MGDVLTKWQRSYCMSRIRGKGTLPERQVRKLVCGLAIRYRLHARLLPGCPDMVFHSSRKAIFVHGCFWHTHRCKLGRPKPKTNAAFWQAKREGTRERDKRNLRALRKLGWQVLVIWECQLRDEGKVLKRLVAFLSAKAATSNTTPHR